MSTLFQFTNIRKSFDQGEHYLDATGYVDGGETLAITGPSGAGKSTLLKILCRLSPPDQGEIRLDGRDFQGIPPQEWRRQVQYVPQKPALFEGTVERNLRMPFALTWVAKDLQFDKQKAQQRMEDLGLSEEMMNQNAGTLSGGEAARVALVRALLLQPRILLLDEPTASLDDKSRQKVLQVMQNWLHEEDGRAVILVSHNQDDLLVIPNIRELKLKIHKGDA